MDNAGKKEIFNVLLIEDNHADIRMMQEVFKELNTKTILNITHNGVEALKFLNKKEKYQNMENPDLILLDLNIPLINGFKVLREIKTNDKLKHIPVIVLTTSHNPKDFLKACELQADCFMNKPLYFDEYNLVLQHIEECWLKN